MSIDLINLVDAIKEKLLDNEYKFIVDECMRLYNSSICYDYDIEKLVDQIDDLQTINASLNKTIAKLSKKLTNKKRFRSNKRRKIN